MELRCKQKREKRKKVKKQKKKIVLHFLEGLFFIFAYLLVFVPGMDTLNSEA